jgi:group I intron endonuclease
MYKIKVQRSGIYGIINLLDGKIYIGQSKDLNGRWRQHKSDLKYNRHRNSHLQSAVNIYGIENFHFVILEECTIDRRDERETYWISYYKSMNRDYGYNNESGGNANKTFSSDTRLKMSVYAKKRVFSEETRRKIGQASKGKKYCLGRKLSEEHKRKISDSSKGRKHSDETKQLISSLSKGKPTWNKGNHLTVEWKEKIGNAHRGKVVSEEVKKKLSESHKGMKKPWVSEANKKRLKPIKEPLLATQEMIEDIHNGISRRKFAEKYKHIDIWVKIRKQIKSA